MKKRAKNKFTSQPNTSSCDWQATNRKSGALQAKPSKVKKTTNKSRVYKHKGNYTWKGIKTEAYKLTGGDWNKIIRRVLIGDGLKTKSHLRYFEIAPGGKSSFEKHRHEHVVIGIRGKGKVILDKRTYKMNFLDVAYISPNTPHQLLNPFDEPFGFLCVVSAKRDKPINLT